MTAAAGIPAGDELETVARALDGDVGAVERLLAADTQGEIARRHRAAEALALLAGRLAREHGLDGPALEPWRRALRRTSAHYLALEAGLEGVAAVLGDTGVAWLPIKGLDLGRRVYPRREARPTSDLDVLIAGDDLDRARHALVAAGWTPLSAGPRQERYLRDEGYAWQARDPRGCLLELHHRLWGSVPTSAARRIVERSEADPGLGATARRPRLAHAYLLAAVHAWTTSPPRGAGLWRDLAQIADHADADHADADHADADLADEVAGEAGRFGLELPVTLAAAVSARLWHRPACRAVDASLRPALRRAEAWVARRSRPEDLGLAALTLARLVGRRPGRQGPRVLVRRLWAHPGVVESATDPRRPWPLRRFEYQWRAYGLPWPSSRAPSPTQPRPDA